MKLLVLVRDTHRYHVRDVFSDLWSGWHSSKEKAKNSKLPSMSPITYKSLNEFIKHKKTCHQKVLEIYANNQWIPLQNFNEESYPEYFI